MVGLWLGIRFSYGSGLPFCMFHFRIVSKNDWVFTDHWNCFWRPNIYYRKYIVPYQKKITCCRNNEFIALLQIIIIISQILRIEIIFTRFIIPIYFGIPEMVDINFESEICCRWRCFIIMEDVLCNLLLINEIVWRTSLAQWNWKSVKIVIMIINTWNYIYKTSDLVDYVQYVHVSYYDTCTYWTYTDLNFIL